MIFQTLIVLTGKAFGDFLPIFCRFCFINQGRGWVGDLVTIEGQIVDRVYAWVLLLDARMLRFAAHFTPYKAVRLTNCFGEVGR